MGEWRFIRTNTMQLTIESNTLIQYLRISDVINLSFSAHHFHFHNFHVTVLVEFNWLELWDISNTPSWNAAPFLKIHIVPRAQSSWSHPPWWNSEQGRRQQSMAQICNPSWGFSLRCSLYEVYVHRQWMSRRNRGMYFKFFLSRDQG